MDEITLLHEIEKLKYIIKKLEDSVFQDEEELSKE